MTVPFQEFLAQANALLDKSAGVPAFRDVLDQVVPILNVSSPADRWEYWINQTTLTIGQFVRWTLAPVPVTEQHEYYHLGLRLEGPPQDFGVQIEFELPTPFVGLLPTFVRNTVAGAFTLNLLGNPIEPVNRDEVDAERPLIVPSRMQLIVRTLTALAGVGPQNISLFGLRRVVLPAFETRRVTEDIATVIT